jgi:hypothetical protein
MYLQTEEARTRDEIQVMIQGKNLRYDLNRLNFQQVDKCRTRAVII